MSIPNRVKDIVANVLSLDKEDKEAITENTTFEFLGADELDVVEIIMKCEEVFAFNFSVEEDIKIAETENATVADLISIVERNS